METKDILIYEDTIVHSYCIQVTNEKFPDVEITKEGKLFIGNKEVEDYEEYREKLHPYIHKLPTRYVIRLWNGSYYGFEGGFDLSKKDDYLFWYCGNRFKTIKDAFKHISDTLKTEDWIISLEEPMQS